MAHGDGSEFQRSRPRTRRPRRVPPGGVEAAALDYLRRFDVPERKLRDHLRAKVRRSAEAHGDDVTALLDEVEAVMARLLARRFVDDGRHAEARATALLARGVPPLAVRTRLRNAGVAASSIEAAIAAWRDAHPEEQPDVEAAWAYARRRGLGPYRFTDRAERRDKDLAAMMRAGHAMRVARAVIDAAEVRDRV